MSISEFIKLLGAAIAKHGDIKITVGRASDDPELVFYVKPGTDEISEANIQ